MKPAGSFRTYKRPPSSLARSIESTPSYSTYWRSILILFSHLYLGLPSGLFLSSLPPKTLCVPILSSIQATWPAHLILLDSITRMLFDEEYRTQISSSRSLLHSPVTSSHLGPYIFLSPLSSKTLSLCFLLIMRDKASHPHKIIDRIILQLILIFIFLDCSLVDKMILHRMVLNISWLE